MSYRSSGSKTIKICYGLFFKLRHLLPSSTLLTLYKTLFEPHLNYCNTIWANTFPTHLKKLESLQNKIIRAISWSKVNSSTSHVFAQYGLLKLREQTYLHNACVMYQVISGINSRLHELIPIHQPYHTYDTRNKHLVFGKTRRLVGTEMSVVCRGPKIWNTLSTTLKAAQSISIFKRQLKKQLLSSYK